MEFGWCCISGYSCRFQVMWRLRSSTTCCICPQDCVHFGNTYHNRSVLRSFGEIEMEFVPGAFSSPHSEVKQCSFLLITLLLAASPISPFGPCPGRIMYPFKPSRLLYACRMYKRVERDSGRRTRSFCPQTPTPRPARPLTPSTYKDGLTGLCPLPCPSAAGNENAPAAGVDGGVRGIEG